MLSHLFKDVVAVLDEHDIDYLCKSDTFFIVVPAHDAQVVTKIPNTTGRPVSASR